MRLRVFSELRKRLLERHFSPAGIKSSLADYLSQSLSNDPDIERRIPGKRAQLLLGYLTCPDGNLSMASIYFFLR